jgi:hypothetical protein
MDQVRFQLASGDSLDSRLVGIAGLDIVFAAAVLSHLKQVGLLGLAAAGFLGLFALACLAGIVPGQWKVGPDLEKAEKIAETLKAAPSDIQFGLLRSIGRAYKSNNSLIRAKSFILTGAVGGTILAAAVAGALYSIPIFTGGTPPWPIATPSPLPTLATRVTPTPVTPAAKVTATPTPVTPAAKVTATPAVSNPGPVVASTSTTRP